MDFFITITTYRREKHLLRLMNHIQRYKKDYTVNGIIINDASFYSFREFDDFGFKYVHLAHHHGRQEFFRIMNMAFDEMKRNNFKYYLNLQDDIILTDDFFDKCVKAWESIKDKNKLILDLRTDDRVGKSLWGIYPVVKVGKFYKSQWFDLVFMSDERIKDKIPKLEFQNIDSSSGVARQLSKRFRKKGFNMYHYERSLVHHGHCESLMNPEVRRKDKLIC